MNAGRLVAALAVTAATSALFAAGTALPVTWHRAGDAALRLSWRARPERIETCRVPTADELAQMAEHMRQRLICEGTSASYLLRVAIDGRQVDSQVVRGGGLRHDRPLQLLRDYPLAAGTRRLMVTLDRREAAGVDTTRGPVAATPEVEGGTFAGRAEREASERSRGRQVAIPPRLVLDTVVAVERGAAILVTLDAGTRRLRVAPRNP